MNRSILCVLMLLAFAGTGFAQAEATLYREPAVSQTQIVFTYAGDLWIVDRAGGEARRLTSGVGEETSPQFSPNGQTVAFTGQYDGNTDVYTVPVTGGVPKRLTWHPGADVVVGWTPDGKRVLFASSRTSVSFYPQLFTIGTDGAGIPEAVPLPMAERGSYSPDGTQIAYEPLTQWQPEWKRYRGGQTDYIWIARLSDSSVEKLPRGNSNDRYPMWVGDKVYFLSDRDGTYTLHAYDTKSKQVARVVPNGELDIKSASAGPGAIVYEQFGALHLFDLKTGRTNRVAIRINADLLTVRPRYERVGTRIASGRISPTGARAVFEARGEIVTVPAEKGDPRNLTNTPGVMERSPAWSPDGRWVSYFSDESGEYALHLRDQKGAGEVKKIALDPSFYESQAWSPDSRKILLTDKRNNLWYVEIEKGTPVRVDKNPFTPGSLSPTWAPDSRWIAYTKQADNYLHAVWVYSLETGKAHQLTDALSDAQSPVFDRSGKYLYFTASTNRGPAIGFAEMSTFPHQSSRSIYAIVLRNDLPSPIAPESDEEKVAEEKKDEKKDAAAPPAAGDKPDEKKADAPGGPRPPAKKEAEPVRIDLEAIDQRIVALPIPSRNYIDLMAGKANLLYVLEAAPSGAGDFTGAPGFTLHKFDLEKRKLDKAMDGVTYFEVSANAEKALLRQGCWACRCRRADRAGRARGRSRSARWRSRSIRRPSGSRCITRSGAGSGISSMRRTRTGSICRRRRRSTRPISGRSRTGPISPIC